jgi:CRP-like cAMP-binding protein/PAS domain-containing protein
MVIMVNVDEFTVRLKNFQENLYELYRNADTATYKPDVMLSAAYKELGTASEELQVAIEELVIQAEEMATAQVQLEAECQHYKNLYEFLPNAHLLTDAQGKILQANPASAILLNIERRFLIGKPLTLFVTQQERRSFLTKLAQIHNCDSIHQWTMYLQPRNSNPLQMVLTVSPSFDFEGKLVALNWSLNDVNQDKLAVKLPNNNDFDPIESRPKIVYRQGEIIPLETTNLWLVCQGSVKLSRMSEYGEEVMVDLVGRDMVFGASITSLPTYQSTALSKEVQLVAIRLSEIENSSHLQEIILPQIIHRLQQTELLLAISRVRQIQERLQHFLSWLKQNFGQKVTQGYRLSFRLTHHEIANVCGTTRVTISRLMGKLKKQGKIAYDRERHLIFLQN